MDECRFWTSNKRWQPRDQFVGLFSHPGKPSAECKQLTFASLCPHAALLASGHVRPFSPNVPTDCIYPTGNRSRAFAQTYPESRPNRNQKAMPLLCLGPHSFPFPFPPLIPSPPLLSLSVKIYCYNVSLPTASYVCYLVRLI